MIGQIGRASGRAIGLAIGLGSGLVIGDALCKQFSELVYSWQVNRLVAMVLAIGLVVIEPAALVASGIVIGIVPTVVSGLLVIGMGNARDQVVGLIAANPELELLQADAVWQPFLGQGQLELQLAVAERAEHNGVSFVLGLPQA